MTTTLTNDGTTIFLTISKDKLTPGFIETLVPHIEKKVLTSNVETQEKSNREDQIMYMFSKFGLDLENDDDDDFSKVVAYLSP
tara:strand:+ start:81 stop:329 length:249 start_codon:yes stop_codon:yes gene_type:complete